MKKLIFVLVLSLSLIFVTSNVYADFKGGYFHNGEYYGWSSPTWSLITDKCTGRTYQVNDTANWSSKTLIRAYNSNDECTYESWSFDDTPITLDGNFVDHFISYHYALYNGEVEERDYWSHY